MPSETPNHGFYQPDPNQDGWGTTKTAIGPTSTLY